MNRSPRRIPGCLAGVFAVLVLGCGDSPTEPAARVEFDPPVIYRTLLQQVEDCSGRAGTLGGIRWYLTSAFPNPGVLAQWTTSREITLRVDVWNDFAVVKHELLHDVLRGDPDHDDPAWATCELPIGVDG